MRSVLSRSVQQRGLSCNQQAHPQAAGHDGRLRARQGKSSTFWPDPFATWKDGYLNLAQDQ